MFKFDVFKYKSVIALNYGSLLSLPILGIPIMYPDPYYVSRFLICNPIPRQQLDAWRDVTSVTGPSEVQCRCDPRRNLFLI